MAKSVSKTKKTTKKTSKSKQPNIENDKLKTKDELLNIMNQHLVQQQQIALELKKQALIYLKSNKDDSETKKKKNHYINSYNQQVDAVSRTSATMIRIYNSSLENGNETEESGKGLVD